MVNKRGITLVLGGGGARGFFHVGVLMAFQRLDVKIDKIVGCSIGAVIGAIYSANPEVDFSEVLEDFNFVKMFRFSGLKSHLVDTKELKKYLTKSGVPQTFNNLKIPLKVSACDMSSGHDVVFDSGNLMNALSASFALPGIFPLVKHKGFILCDGGVVNPLPINLAKTNKLIVSDITLPPKELVKKLTPTNIVRSTLALPQKRITDRNFQDAKNKKIIHLKLGESIDMMDWRTKNVISLIIKGQMSVLDQISQIRNMH